MSSESFIKDMTTLGWKFNNIGRLYSLEYGKILVIMVSSCCEMHAAEELQFIYKEAILPYQEGVVEMAKSIIKNG